MKNYRSLVIVFAFLFFCSTSGHLAEYIKRERIQKHVALLEQCINNGKEIQISSLYDECPEMICTHDLIKTCMNDIVAQSSFKPAFKIWNTFTELFCGTEHDDLFLNEFSVILYSMYQQCFQALAYPEISHIAASDFVRFCNKITQLSFQDRLRVLDILYPELDDLMHQEGIGPSYMEWFSQSLLHYPSLVLVLGLLAYITFLK